jgi:hypothetical protein
VPPPAVPAASTDAVPAWGSGGVGATTSTPDPEWDGARDTRGSTGGPDDASRRRPTAPAPNADSGPPTGVVAPDTPLWSSRATLGDDVPAGGGVCPLLAPSEASGAATVEAAATAGNTCAEVASLAARPAPPLLPPVPLVCTDGDTDTQPRLAALAEAGPPETSCRDAATGCIPARCSAEWWVKAESSASSLRGSAMLGTPPRGDTKLSGTSAVTSNASRASSLSSLSDASVESSPRPPPELPLKARKSGPLAASSPAVPPRRSCGSRSDFTRPRTRRLPLPFPL